eukprot:TRINITY_DN4417_c0_g1_i2.p1 TRINITY_DN4417_c0_g1~~TRINITY_DN4417_c0_g1_i2.p1  ORF type:complete len:448 (+),score=118.58 TRINITY_DN4417_c0_g1_i2:567-1910(+)
MDGAQQSMPISKEEGRPTGRVLVIAATNRPNALDPALRRPGRFDREIAMAMPTTEERRSILRLHSRGLPLGDDVDLAAIARLCQGYVGADLAALCREAAMSALRRKVRGEGTEGGGGSKGGGGGGGEGRGEVVDEKASRGGEEEDRVTFGDWMTGMKRVGPSVVRGAAAEVPAVAWEEIGGLADVKKRLARAVEWPIRHADAFVRLGIAPQRGVLLHGPPGCAKTTLVRAAAHAAQAPLLTLSGAELYSMFVGESEALLRATFQRARLAAPCIVFLDEVDALAPKRSDGADGSAGGGGSVGERLLAALLVEMDGLELAQGVLVMAATNRLQALDPALVRPGRFDLVLLVPPPDEVGRVETLRQHSKGMALAADVDLREIASSTDLFTGAELAGLCREAAMGALRESVAAIEVEQVHFLRARAAMHASLTPLALAGYSALDRSRGGEG